jgi:hypothetical protein
MQFNNPTHQKMKIQNITTRHHKKAIGRALSWRCGFVLVPLALVCFGLSPTAKALLPAPPPDGGYPGGNTAEGNNALHDVNTAVGINNTAVGANALGDNTTGAYNVGIGSGALANNTTGNFNMAVGAGALLNNKANFNLAIGYRVLFMNTTGNHLTGIGAAALLNNTIAGFNTAIGADALTENTIGENNTAIGADALSSNINGTDNNAVGNSALANNTTGDFNEALGSFALVSNNQGLANVAIGESALGNNDANFNTVVGFDAGLNLTLSTSSENIYIGDSAGAGAGDESGTIRIGSFFAGNTACFINGIFGNLTPGTAVFINSAGQLSTTLSARRFKKDIDPMDKTSEAIYSLKPVTFHYKSDKTNMPCFGLIAEEVAAVNPDLVLRDEKGEMYSVRYEQINAMLLNEFLKEHRKVQEQEATIAQLKNVLRATVAQQQKQLLWICRR